MAAADNLKKNLTNKAKRFYNIHSVHFFIKKANASRPHVE